VRNARSIHLSQPRLDLSHQVACGLMGSPQKARLGGQRARDQIRLSPDLDLLPGVLEDPSEPPLLELNLAH
jgi:hypothetical protein